jgi:signal peptidase II
VTRTRRYALVGGVAVAVVLLDQLAKWWAVERLSDGPIGLFGSVRLALARNSGGAFGLGRGFAPMVVLAVVALVVVLVSVGRSIDKPAVAIALGLVLGGALGNLADRVFRAPGVGRGEVVDFIDFRFWPVFNVADIAITCGCVLLVVLSLRGPVAADKA